MKENAFAHRVTGHQAQDALVALITVFSDGLRHGFFDYTLSCEIIQGGKRVLIIDAGKKYRFTIPEDQLHEVSTCRLMGFERRNEE